MGQPERLEGSKPAANFALTFLAVIGMGILLFLVVMPRTGSSGDARKQAAKSQVRDFGAALEKFKVDNGHYPTAPNALQELVTAPVGATNWHPYLDSIPLDPWQHPYVYECPGKRHTNAYDIFSTGPDARAGTKDDIGNW